MKNKYFGKLKIAAASAAALLIGVSSLSLPVYAAEADNGTSDANVTFTGGALTLESVPSFDFGTHEISAGPEVYQAVNPNGTAQVSDLRGSGQGWTLSAALSGFSVNSESVLQGASIDIVGVNVEPESGTVSDPPTAQSGISLTSDNTSARVVSAGIETGKGVWNNVFPSNTVLLHVLPGTAKVGNSVAQIDWVLEDTP